MFLKQHFFYVKICYRVFTQFINKGGRNTIYETQLKKLQQLNLDISTIQQKISSLPPGKLIIARNNCHYKWYVNNGRKTYYLSKSQRNLAEQLALKKYLSLNLKELIYEKKSLEKFLSHLFPHENLLNYQRSTPFQSDSDKLLCDSPYQELLRPYYSPKSETITNWLNEPYEKNTNYANQLIYKSFSGNILRSKSESIIDMALYMNKIPFRYECALHLGDDIFYPDFTIMHPISGKIYYWEHFGMMDNPNYSKSAYSKLQFYGMYDIFPSINLITTFETSEVPLCSDTIAKTIELYFL